VAVKSLRSHRADLATLEKVLQEALVLARLEHPNIVPVYDIASGESGLPRIVMKRVMGDEWSRFIHDDAAAGRRVTGDALSWHVEVFLQICNAVAYAHSRGLVHLDIKPSNVMLGPFGEVYLLDWGVAMATRDDVDPRIPRLEQCAPPKTPKSRSWLPERSLRSRAGAVGRCCASRASTVGPRGALRWRPLSDRRTSPTSLEGWSSKPAEPPTWPLTKPGRGRDPSEGRRRVRWARPLRRESR
jgi:serine/threonine protein kinase